MIWDNLKRLNMSILVKKKEKQHRQSGILLMTMLKILDSYLYMKLNLAKNQIWIRSSTSRGNSNIEHEEGVCHNQEVLCEQASLHSDSTLYCKREGSNETSCLSQLYFERIQRTVPNFGRLYVC